MVTHPLRLNGRQKQCDSISLNIHAFLLRNHSPQNKDYHLQ